MERARGPGTGAAALTFEPHPRELLPAGRALVSSDRRGGQAAPARRDRPRRRGGDDLRRSARAALPPRNSSGHPGGSARGERRVIGFNFHFGKDGRLAGLPRGAGRAARLRGRRGAAVQRRGRRVSSGADARRARRGRHRRGAAELLGYPWFVTAQVVHGDKRGRELGYPTANLRARPGCGLKHGIYAVRVGIGGTRYDGRGELRPPARRSTTARRCSRCTCSISPATSTAGARRGIHRLDPAGNEVRRRSTRWSAQMDDDCSRARPCWRGRRRHFRRWVDSRLSRITVLAACATSPRRGAVNSAQLLQ